MHDAEAMMTRARRLILGVATMISAGITVPVLWALFIGHVSESEVAIDLYSMFCIYHALLFLIYYRDVFRNDRVPLEMKHSWTIILFLGLAFAQLVYFWRFIWRERVYAL
jgi:hypothetical protein